MTSTKPNRPARVRAAVPPTLPDAAMLGISAPAQSDLRRQVERGLPFSSWEHLQSSSGLSAREMARLLHINVKTLGRRKTSNRLSPTESDRLARLSRVLCQAIALFEGDSKAARQWLETPRSALGGEAPLEVARTEIGAREVEQLIERLEDGTFT